MLSYNARSRDLVLKIHEILLKESIPVWLDEHRQMQENVCDRYERKH